MKTHTKYYKVAGITVQVNSDYPISEKTFHPKFKLFETDGLGNDNIILNHHFYLSDTVDSSCSKKAEIYNKNQWRIFKTRNSWIYKYTPVFAEDPGHPAIGKFNEDHTVVDIYSDAITDEYYKNAQFSALTLFNTDQVLFAKILSDRRGLIIHSNGFDISGKGILLTGDSGAGKSTLSQMLKQKGFEILCDDRMFVKYSKNDFWIHGHWCHGTVPDVSSISVPLKAIFFLEQAKNNTIIKIEDKKTLSLGLFRSIVKPFLSPNGWDATFTILEEIIQQIDCYTIKFNLDGDICDEICNLMENYQYIDKRNY